MSSIAPADDLDDRDAYVGPPVFDTAEVCRIAQNVAQNCGYAVFPVRLNKHPTTPHGKDDASTDPERIAWLWRRYPGPLIGVATGGTSNISILDIDTKHDGARAWWRQNEIRLPTTRTYRTRGGGFHLVFRHAAGVRNVAGKPVEGIDGRGEGGYFIFWFATGLPCLDHAPPAPWPHWLTPFFWPPAPAQDTRRPVNHDHPATIDGLIRTVRAAQEGTRNGKLFWATCRMRDRGFGRADAERELLAAAASAGLSETEARRTVASAWRTP
jgi:hypothetical protein